MADVFISYKREERAKILQVAAGLERLGVSVWFDARIPSGSSFDDVIVKELDRAFAVLACWSPRAIKSRYVKGEASYADKLKSPHSGDQSKLVTCFIAPTNLPPPFNMMQTEDIADWKGEVSHEGWRKIVKRIGMLCGRPGLFALLKAIDSNQPAKLKAWAQEFPDDPMAGSMVQEWIKRERELFARNCADVLVEIRSLAERQSASAMAQIDRIANEFDTWISSGAEDQTTRPDPHRLLATGGTGNVRDRVEALTRAQKLAEAQLDALEGERDRLITEKERLQHELSAIKARPPLVTGPGYAGAERRKLAAAAVIAALLAGTAGYVAVMNFGPDDQSLQAQLSEQSTVAVAATDRAAKAEADARLARDQWQTFERRGTEVERNLGSVKQELNAAERRAKDIEAERDKARAEARELESKLAASAASAVGTPLRIPSVPLLSSPVISPTPSQQNATTRCTELAGNRFDLDNKSGAGPSDMSAADFSIDTVRSAIEVCDQAIRSARGQPERRLMEAQKGRAQVEMAARLSGNNPDAARGLMTQAVATLRSSAAAGSGSAMNLLGAYYNGSLNQRLNFISPDADQAFHWWKQSAEAGNLTGRVNYAAKLLDKELPSINNPDEAARQLNIAEQHNPRAFVVWADGILSGQFQKSLSVEQRRRSAAQVAEKARCNGDPALTEAWFRRNAVVQPYRNVGSC